MTHRAARSPDGRLSAVRPAVGHANVCHVAGRPLRAGSFQPGRMKWHVYPSG